MVPPFDRYAVIPVARNVWQHVEGGSPAAAARRLIIPRTTRRYSTLPVTRRHAGSTLWNSAHLRLLEPGRLDVLVEGRRRPVVAGTSCRRPPFSWSLSHPRLPCPK